MKSEKATICAKDYGSNNYLTDRLTMNNLPNFNFKSNRDGDRSRRELLEQAKLSRLPGRRTFKLSEVAVIKITAFVCDECARPLHLYGENFVETYTNGKANVLRCLCDLHADEMEVKER